MDRRLQPASTGVVRDSTARIRGLSLLPMALPTERGYDEQSVTQLAVFLSNRVGELREVLRKLHAAQVVVHALSIDESVDYAVLRVIVDKVEACKQALRAAGFAVSESTLMAVELPDD